MRNSWWYAARRPPSLGLLLPLAVAALMVGFVESNSSALKLFQPRRPCPVYPPVETPPLEWTTCPDRCSCSSEDVQLSCQGPNLPDLSDTGAVDLRSMVVEGVGIRRLEAKHFRGLYSMQFLTLSIGRIEEIAEDAFMNLPFLIHLDLSKNEIVEIPVNAFTHNKNLFSLRLDGNPLHVPSSGPLLLSESLQILVMRGCGISSVNSQTFAGVPLLAQILMEDNALTEFPSEALSGLEWLCDIRVNALTKIDTNGARDTNNGKDLPDTESKYKEILIGLTILVVSVIIVVCILIYITFVRPCSRNEREDVRDRRLSSSEYRSRRVWTETPGPTYEEIDYRTMVNGRLGGYQIVGQSDMRPSAHGYPVAYNGVDSFIVHDFRAENNEYVPVSNYRRPIEVMPPPPCKCIGMEKSPSHIASISTSTTDLRTSATSDVNVSTVNVNNNIENANPQETVDECSRQPDEVPLL